MKTKAELDFERLQRAKEIAREVKTGNYQPAAFDKESSWWPSRPVIKKNLEDMNRVYNGETK